MSRLMAMMLALAVLTLMACGDDATTSESVRLDLGDGLVVAFVKGQSPELPGKVAYLTHVPSGSQAVLDSEGRIIERHNGRDDGTSRLDAVLADEAAMERITRGIQSDDEHLPSRKEHILWIPSVKFGGITYLGLDGSVLTADQLGHELHRVAFRVDGYVGSSYSNQDGDATFLNPGTPVYAVKGYSPKFRLATVEGDKVTIYEVDTNPQAKIAEDLLDIRGKVTAIDILSEEDATTVLGGIGKESAVSQFVQAALASPVDQEAGDHEGERYFLGFRLADGTSVVRSFWMDSGELSRGIMTDPTVATSVRRALSNEESTQAANRPVQWGGGTGITLPQSVEQGSGGADDPEVEHPDVVRQHPETEPAPDNIILAAETGLPLEEIDRAIAFQEAFGKYAEDLIGRFPEQISGVWMDSPPGAEGPSTRGHIRFVGQVPANLPTMENVTLTGGAEISMGDQRSRAKIAAKALSDAGYGEFATFFSSEENLIHVELLLEEASPRPTKSDIVATVRQFVESSEELEGRASEVVASDIALTVLRGSGPFITLEHSRGGNWLLTDGDYTCTSGWSVEGDDGDGIMTAARCDDMDEFEEPSED